MNEPNFTHQIRRTWAKLYVFFATISCFLTNGQSALRPKVQVQIKGTKGQSNFLYDTGSQLCLIGKNEFRKISINQRPKKLHVKLTCSGVSEKALKLLDCYLLEIEILGKKFLHPTLCVISTRK